MRWHGQTAPIQRDRVLAFRHPDGKHFWDCANLGESRPRISAPLRAPMAALMVVMTLCEFRRNVAYSHTTTMDKSDRLRRLAPDGCQTAALERDHIYRVGGDGAHGLGAAVGGLREVALEVLDVGAQVHVAASELAEAAEERMGGGV